MPKCVMYARFHPYRTPVGVALRLIDAFTVIEAVAATMLASRLGCSAISEGLPALGWCHGIKRQHPASLVRPPFAFSAFDVTTAVLKSRPYVGNS